MGRIWDRLASCFDLFLAVFAAAIRAWNFYYFSNFSGPDLLTILAWFLHDLIHAIRIYARQYFSYFLFSSSCQHVLNEWIYKLHCANCGQRKFAPIHHPNCGQLILAATHCPKSRQWICATIPWARCRIWINSCGHTLSKMEPLTTCSHTKHNTKCSRCVQ